MGYSKRQFVAAAFEEIGLASYVFDLQPEQLQSAMRRLDAMMADWNGKGIQLGYPLPGSPQDSDLDEPSEVPDSANQAIITNLAIRIAPSYGKVVMLETKAVAKDSYNTLLSRAAMPPEQQLPGTMPSGAGNKTTVADSFMPKPADRLTTGTGDTLDIPGEEMIVNLDNEFILTQQTIINNVTNVTNVTPLTWSDYVDRWDSPPTLVGTAFSPVAGSVYEYILGGFPRYRLVPTIYDPKFDAFYETFAGGALSGLIAARNT